MSRPAAFLGMSGSRPPAHGRRRRHRWTRRPPVIIGDRRVGRHDLGDDLVHRRRAVLPEVIACGADRRITLVVIPPEQAPYLY